MQGYDLDDTLARVDFRQAATHTLAELFAAAPVLYVPHDYFVVITVRPGSTSGERTATADWLAAHQPSCRGIHYVTASSTTAGTASSKAAVINRLKLSDYTDNNMNVLAALAGLTTVQLWQIHDG